MPKNLKKILIYVCLGLDTVITTFLFVVSIIMIVRSMSMTGPEIRVAKGFIGYLQNHSSFYFGLFVVPLFVLLAVNIIVLVVYVKQTEKKKEIKVVDLTDEQKEILKKQLIEELNNK